MQNSRNSSVWKSLAAAFGDGLAFGVGMKLSQNGASHRDRIAQAPAAPPPVAVAPFDRKVLESVVNAVDDRLKEHTGQLERRIAELETKIALELKSLSKQDEAVVSAVEEVRTWCDARIATIRGDVDQGLAALREQLAAKNGEFLELRRQIAESGSASRDLLKAVGQAWRDAAERVIPPPPVSAA
jgi:flagellar motility protein MotE (MotC chaperone)